jgi:CRISPR-associated endonuclease/helicase Cas3
MQRAETKVQRILQIESLLLDHPEGLSQSEIARRIGVNRSTVHRYLPDLTQHAPIFEEDGRLFIDRKAYLVNLRLNLFEALSLHLAARLLTNRMERHNPHTAALLRKLSATIEKLSPRISRHLALSARVADDPERFQDPHYLDVLETLSLAWAEGRKVRVWHRHTDTQRVHEYLFSVYFIEPHAVGYAIHAIGLRQPPNAIRTFNLARIERVELTRETYQIPADFDPTDLLRQAWGIWYTEDDPEEVRLRFSAAAAWRVGETRWHPTQVVEAAEDGSLIWSARVAEPREMLPWVRGWGADVEVIEPGWMRKTLMAEVFRLTRVYNIHLLQSDSDTPDPEEAFNHLFGGESK